MPVGNLTRDEAVHRAALIATDSYAVGLDLTTSTTTFRSTTVIRFSCCEPGASTFADLMDATVSEVRLNGRSIDPSTAYDGARLALDDLAADNELRVVADCAYVNTGEGLHRFVDPVDGGVYLYSQFETADAKRMFACFDQPDLKARYTVTVTAPADWQVVSNAAIAASGPSTPASASIATRARLTSGCCAVRETPAVWVWNRSWSDRSRVAP